MSPINTKALIPSHLEHAERGCPPRSSGSAEDEGVGAERDKAAASSAATTHEREAGPKAAWKGISKRDSGADRAEQTVAHNRQKNFSQAQSLP